MAAEADLDETGQEIAGPENTSPEKPGLPPRRVIVMRGGPTLIEGPVQLEMDGEDPIVLDRFMVAICGCRRSGSYPLCDGTHRRAQRS